MQSLNALHPRLIATANFDPADPAVVTDWAPQRGLWQQVGPLTRPTFFHQTNIDLSGYVRQEKTLFPSGVGIQDPGIYKFFLQAGSPPNVQLQVIDIITSSPLGDEAILDLSDKQLAQTGPGMLGSPLEFEQILMGSYRSFTTDTSFTSLQGSLSLQRSQRFGSGEPTAADTLFCYRIVAFALEPSFPLPTLPGDSITVPPARFIVNGEFVEEADLVHLFRLKRSYELEQS